MGGSNPCAAWFIPVLPTHFLVVEKIFGVGREQEKKYRRGCLCSFWKSDGQVGEPGKNDIRGIKGTDFLSREEAGEGA